MDIEQFRMVLEALNTAGVGAKEFGMWWLAAHALSNVLLFIFGLTTVVLLITHAAGFTRAWDAAHVLAKELNLHIVRPWLDADTNQCVSRIRELRQRADQYTREQQLHEQRRHEQQRRDEQKSSN
jgi:hypothetical protein